jgi:opacity protein-like surface antigen
MKKLLIATAVAATMATGAQAAKVYDVTSDITAVGLYLGDLDLMSAEAPGYITNFQFGGTATDDDDNGTIDSSALTLTGIQGFTVNALPIRLTYNLSNGGYVAGSGVTFTGGNILIEVQTTEGYVPYGTIDASVTHLPFLANQPGHWSDQYPAQTTAGLLLAPGVNNLPGLWDQVAESGSFNNGVAALTLLGQSSGMFLQGTVSLVPVPGAAWLFGSAVIGLVGASRKRKTA